MTPAECATVLAVAQAFDRRTVGELDVEAWHKAIGDLNADECRSAVTAHYTRSREWCMPFDVRNSVKALRADRLARAVEGAPDADPDDVPEYLRALRDGRTRTADATVPRDLRGLPRTFPSVPRSTYAQEQA